MRSASITCLVSLAAASLSVAACAQGRPATVLSDQRVEPASSRDVPFVAPPLQPGQRLVLKFSAVCIEPNGDGCNYNLALLVNGRPVDRRTPSGSERILNRASSAVLSSQATSFPLVSNDALLVMLAPSLQRAEGMTSDNQGADFVLDLTDLVQAGARNVLTFRNALVQPPAPGQGQVQVVNVSLSSQASQATHSAAEATGSFPALRERVSSGTLQLAEGRQGGFVLGVKGGPELAVETEVEHLNGRLAASDSAGGVPVSTSRLSDGFALTSQWGPWKLRRELRLKQGALLWNESWTNAGAQDASLPFHHTLRLAGGPREVWIDGSPDTTSISSTSPNPTVFMGAASKSGAGFGLLAESDWLRLGTWVDNRAGVVDVYSHSLAVSSGQTLQLSWSLSPVGNGGYWGFVNRLRTRLGLNGLRAARPIFWDYSLGSNAISDDALRHAFGDLGPVAVAVEPWIGLQSDAEAVVHGDYPRLPAGAPPTPGPTSDLDLTRFLTFAHREKDWNRFRDFVQRTHRVCPNVQVLEKIHPGMQVAYKPLAERWPWARDVVGAENRLPFEVPDYDRSWLGPMVSKGWAVFYYVPTAGSAWLAELLRGITRSLDSCGADGIYVDEFSWTGFNRAYSRYDYSHSDGHTAVLNAAGGIAARVSDNAATSLAGQEAIISSVVSRHKLLLANGAPASSKLMAAAYFRFVEGGNGEQWFGTVHLSPTPLVLGNFGDRQSLAGIMHSVRACLMRGCLYSPPAVNLVVRGSDNFVCKQFPITVRALGPGTVTGRERIVSAVSLRAATPWPGRTRVLRYDGQGRMLGAVVTAERTLSIEVPPAGLAIAEAIAE